MKIAIFGTEKKLKKKYFKTRIDAYLRNCLIISKYLDATFLYNVSEYNKYIDTKFDAILIFYANYYAPIKQMKIIAGNNKNANFYLILNEYNISPIYTFLKNKKLIKITNFKKDGAIFLNLNLLFSKTPNELINKKYNCIYYGTFRKNRVKYFKKYLKNDIYLSTSNKNFKKYKHVGCSPKWISKLSWEEKKETLNLFRYSLYIEDEYTHKVFNNLANRWYEAGFCNVVMFFDVNCWNTINKSEIAGFKEQIKDYIVKDYDELKTKIDYCNKNFEKHLAIQKSWRLQESYLRKKMLEDLKEIIYNN